MMIASLPRRVALTCHPFPEPCIINHNGFVSFNKKNAPTTGGCAQGTCAANQASQFVQGSRGMLLLPFFSRLIVVIILIMLFPPPSFNPFIPIAKL